MLRLATLLVTLAVTTTVAAAEPAERPAPRKSKVTAMSLSIGSLVAGGALAYAASETTEKAVGGPLAIASAGAFLVGPSLGHIYVGEWGKATVTTLGRAAGSVLVINGLAHALDEAKEPHDPLIWVGAVVGVAMVVGSTAFDLIDTPFAVDRANRGLTVAPTVLPTPDGGRAAGLSIGGRF